MEAKKEMTRLEYDECAGRCQELEEALGRLEAGEARLMEEMGQVDQQLAHYASLTREMKSTMAPPRLARLLRALRGP